VQRVRRLRPPTRADSQPRTHPVCSVEIHCRRGRHASPAQCRAPHAHAARVRASADDGAVGPVGQAVSAKTGLIPKTTGETVPFSMAHCSKRLAQHGNVEPSPTMEAHHNSVPPPPLLNLRQWMSCADVCDAPRDSSTAASSTRWRCRRLPRACGKWSRCRRSPRAPHPHRRRQCDGSCACLQW
jgi:hypothetical protein